MEMLSRRLNKGVLLWDRRGGVFSLNDQRGQKQSSPHSLKAIIYDDFLACLLSTYCTEGLTALSVRRIQPYQQQGRRMPSLSSVRTLSTCCLLVSGFFTEIAQQIHSLRARGVRSSHEALACASEARVFRKSSGNSWTTPPEMSLLVIVIRLSYYKIALSRKDCRSERASSIGLSSPVPN